MSQKYTIINIKFILVTMIKPHHVDGKFRVTKMKSTFVSSLVYIKNLHKILP